jgi:RHS repeat-associated protein
VEKVDGVIINTQILDYDGAGNVITDGEYTYTWQMGRQLQGISGTDITTSYKYNENGLRSEKIVNGMKHEYTYLGSSVTREIIKELVFDAQGNIIDETILWTIHYSYAGDSSPVSMNVNGTEYYYLKNAQGDITHIVDTDGNEVASYEYDAWGNHLRITGDDVIAELNPYRYRGYRYDSETGLYYLQSRYYNPEWGRFINADAIMGSVGELLDHNWYAYCGNNPVSRLDEDGEAWVVVGAIAGAIVGGIVGGVISYKRNGSVDWRYVAGGAVTGALIGSGVGLIAAKATTAATAATAGSGALTSDVLSKGPVNTVVYKGLNAGKQVYVGISKNLPQRIAAHGDRFDRINEITDPLTRLQARAVEQVIIEYARVSSLGYQNIINSISPKNPIYNEAIRWGTEFCRIHNFLR